MSSTAPQQTRIGWIGTGVMGKSMCGHLITAGFPTTVYSRTKEKAEALLAAGASWVATPAEVAGRSDVIFTMVGFPQDVRDVYFSENGVLKGARPGALLVDMTTTEPTLAREIQARAVERGCDAVDAPVSGGDVGARNQTLSIMVGGDKGAVERVMPLFQILGKNIVHQGGPGAGQHTKMCNQIVIAGTMIGVCESLVYAYRAKLNPESMLQSIRSGAAGCWTLENLAPRVLKGNFEPGFIVEHFIKDMGIALSEAQRMRLAMPGLALVHQLYVALQAQGHGRRGTHALVLALEHISNLERPAVVA
ncbi:MAG TPA: NAD(P)-dependent oxidoreductase [Vicinamibacterales bacterium]|nr:NAD(P)-dependent oxidoreductase [Vicinamibacterales bacterium]